MKISVRREKGIAILEVDGNIIADAGFDFQEAVQRQVRLVNEDSIRGLIINLNGVHMTSIGLGALVGAYLELIGKGKKLVLLGSKGAAERLLRITKLDNFIEQRESEEEAIRSFED